MVSYLRFTRNRFPPPPIQSIGSAFPDEDRKGQIAPMIHYQIGDIHLCFLLKYWGARIEVMIKSTLLSHAHRVGDQKYFQFTYKGPMTNRGQRVFIDKSACIETTRVTSCCKAILCEEKKIWFSIGRSSFCQ